MNWQLKDYGRLAEGDVVFIANRPYRIYTSQRGDPIPRLITSESRQSNHRPGHRRTFASYAAYRG